MRRRGFFGRRRPRVEPPGTTVPGFEVRVVLRPGDRLVRRGARGEIVIRTVKKEGEGAA